MTPNQRSILLLWQRVNTSLTAFYKLILAFGNASKALRASSDEWAKLGIHAKHIARHTDANVQQDNRFINNLLQRVDAGEFQLLFKDNPDYPIQLTQLFDPPPVLFCKGDPTRLNQPQIAIVGSRKPSVPAQKFTFDMAQYLAQSGYIITSGLAQGVDAQAHLGALAQDAAYGGRTIGVMGTGIDVCYPKQHQPLFNRVVNEGGCIISELLPGTLPNKHTFPRRNRLVAGLSLGTIVTEAAIKSGSLITARLTSEQGKQVFALPSAIDNSNAEGCHHLIREGATLIYHPDQVINEISNQIIAPITAQTLKVADAKEMTNANDNEKSPVSIINSVTSTFSSEHQTINNAELDKNNSATLNSKTLNPQSLTETFNLQLSSYDSSLQNGKARNSDTQNNIAKHIVVSEHLQPLWVHIDWNGQDLDALVAKTQLDTPTLLSQLMELELLGAITQIAGRYKRL